MKNVKIEYAQTILDYFILEELTHKCDTMQTLKLALYDFDYITRDIYRYPEKMIDIENDCGAIFTIVDDTNSLYLCRDIEYIDSQCCSHYSDIKDFLENLQKMLDKQ